MRFNSNNSKGGRRRWGDLRLNPDADLGFRKDSWQNRKGKDIVDIFHESALEKN
jgi:hypothetical protein